MLQTGGKQFLGGHSQLVWLAFELTARTRNEWLNHQTGRLEEPQEKPAISSIDSSSVSTRVFPSAIHSPFPLQLPFGTWRIKETVALASEQHSAHCVVVQTGEQHVWEMDRDGWHFLFEADIYRCFLPFEALALSSLSAQNICSQMFAERAPLICKGRWRTSLYIAISWSCPL